MGMSLPGYCYFQERRHILKNFQPVLFKPYYNAGLKKIAGQCGFNSSTLTALIKSVFQLENYIMQVAESIFRSMRMLPCFLNHRHEFQLRSRCTFTSTRIEGAVYDLFDALSRYPKLIATNVSTFESEFMQFLAISYVSRR